MLVLGLKMHLLMSIVVFLVNKCICVEPLLQGGPFTGSISVGKWIYIVAEIETHKIFFAKVPYPAEGSLPLVNIMEGYNPKNKNPDFFAQTQMEFPFELKREYRSIQIVESPYEEHVYVHFYRHINQSNVVVFSEKYKNAGEEMTAQVHHVAAQHLGEITYAIHAFKKYDFLFAFHDKRGFGIRTGWFSQRTPDANFKDVRVTLRDDRRLITFNEELNRITIHPVNELTSEEPNLAKFFPDHTDIQAFYHKDHIYVLKNKDQNVKVADKIVIFKAVLNLETYESDDCFQTPYSTLTWAAFWSENAMNKNFANFPYGEVSVNAPSRAHKIMIALALLFIVLVVICMLGTTTGIFDFKSADRRTYFADAYIRKIQDKDKTGTGPRRHRHK